MKLIKYIFLSICVAFSACQDSQFTDPLDFEDTTGIGDPDPGSYAGGAPIILLEDGGTTGTLDFNQYTYPSTDYLSASGNSIGLSSSGLNNVRLDLFDNAGAGTYQATLPVLTNSRRSSVVEADVTIPSGAADSGYQIARAYSADLDGDNIEDTVAYAVIVLGGVQVSPNADDTYVYNDVDNGSDPSSAHAIAALLLGVNAETDSDDEQALQDTYGSTYADVFGTNEQIAVRNLADYLGGNPGVVIARSAEFSGQNDSAVGNRTDSGLAVQIIPITLLSNGPDLFAGGQLLVVPDDIDGAGGENSNSWADGTMGYAACEANGGTIGGGTCTSANAAAYANEWRANRIGFGLAQGSSYSNGSDDDGVTGDIADFQIYDGSSDRDHSIKVEFNVLNASKMQVVVTLTDEDDNEVVVTSTDTLTATIGGTQADLGGTDKNIETDSERIDIARCYDETDLTNSNNGFADFTIDPYYYASQNVFAEFDQCQDIAVPAVTLGDGTTLFSKMFSGGVNGYAVTLGYIPAGALAFDSSKGAEEAGAQLDALNALMDAGGQEVPTVSNIVISIPDVE